MRPRLLDLYCGAGGCSEGYARAGFDVVGVDLSPMPNYPYEFHQDDALNVLRAIAERGPFYPSWLGQFDAVHASPPCHDHTPLRSLAGRNGTGALLDVTRTLLEATGLPWVIENVPGAPMRPDLILCGGMFGLRTYRHRWFEFSPDLGLIPVKAHPKHVAKTATKRRRERWAEGWHVSVTGDVGTYLGPEAMGIDWMTGNELTQAIPPAYTEYVGRILLERVRERAA